MFPMTVRYYVTYVSYDCEQLNYSRLCCTCPNYMSLVAKKNKKIMYEIMYMRPGATKGTLRRKNENSLFDVFCLITFHWSFKKKI